MPRPLLRYGFVPQNPLDPIAGPHARRADPIHVPILLARHAPAASSRPRPDRSRNAGGGCGWGLAGGDGEGRRRGLARRVLPHMPSARLRPRLVPQRRRSSPVTSAVTRFCVRCEVLILPSHLMIHLRVRYELHALLF